MGSGGTTATFTSDFRRSYAAETGQLLTRRFLWFGCTMVGISLLGWIAVLIFGIRGQGVSEMLFQSDVGLSKVIAGLTLMVISTLAYVGSTMFVWFDKPSLQTTVRVSIAVVTLDGISTVTLRALGVETTGMHYFMISHLIACAFLPWTPRQAVQVALLVLSVSAVSELAIENDTFFNTTFADLVSEIFAIVLSPALMAPGVVVAWMKSSRRLQQSKLRFLSQRYGEVRRELTDARKIHESLFPSPLETGPVRMSYRYAPMRQIGGDFLYVCNAPPRGVVGEDGLNVVLIDVTGHGIPAALTVNRLHGELERIFAEDPLVSPGEVLSLLNRYVHLTLAPHSIYGTAVCLKIDPEEGVVEFASGGHPPAYIRAVDGTIERLDSTSFVLGACPDEAFDPEPRTHRFGPGDSLIVYSDGVTEARDPDGRMLGLLGLEALLAGRVVGADGAWPDTLASELDAYRQAPPEDDTLVVELYRPIQTGPATKAARERAESQAGPESEPESAPA